MRSHTLRLRLPLLLATLLLSAFARPARSGPVDDLKQWLARPRGERPDLAAQSFAKAPLTKEQAKDARQLLWNDHAAFIREDRKKEWEDKAITADGKTLLVTSRWARKLTVVDLEQKKVASQVTVGKSPHGVWTLNHAPTR